MAIPAEKVVHNARVDTFNKVRTTCGSPPYSQAAVTIVESVAITAARQRPKPAFLYPTGMTWVYKDANGPITFDTDTCYVPPQSAIGAWSGTFPAVNGGRNKQISINTFAAADALQAKAFSKFTTRSGDIAESAFELRSTSKMVAGRIKSLTNLAKSLKRGEWRNIEGMIGDVPSSVTRLKPAKRLADGWLELQFGWLPWLSTIHTAVDVYRNRIVMGQTLKAKSSGGAAPTTNNFNEIASKLESGGWPSVTVVGQVSNPGLATLNSMGFLNPALIAWNLLPYSFVVDWVVPITPVLASLTSGIGLTNRYKVRSRQIGTFRKSTSNSWPTWRYTGNVTSYREVTANPSVLFAPNWSPRNSSVGLLTTATALFAQQFGRSR